MDDAGPPHLELVDVDANARLFDAVLETMAGVPKPTRAPTTTPLRAAEFGRLVALVMRLEQRVEALEAELVPLHRSRKCPRCHQLFLVVVAARPHPEFGPEGIEQHEVRCGCGYQASRLHDPRDFLR
jgi:hypothetical protein